MKKDELKAEVAQVENSKPRLKRCLNEFWSLRVSCQKGRNKNKCCFRHFWRAAPKYS